MADDFRSKLYRKYVSRFKKEKYSTNEAQLVELNKVLGYRFRQILKGLSKDSSIVELGCGPGFLLNFLKNQGFEKLEGVDISEEQISIARESGLNVKLADAVDFLQEKKQEYDVLIAIDFIEHFRKEELFGLFELISDVLKENGLLIIQTPNGQGLFPGGNIYGDLTHTTIFTELSLRQILQFHEFGDIKFFETGPAPISMYSSIRFILWKVIRVFLKWVRRIETNKTTELWTENLICTCRKHE